MTIREDVRHVGRREVVGAEVCDREFQWRECEAMVTKGVKGEEGPWSEPEAELETASCDGGMGRTRERRRVEGEYEAKKSEGEREGGRGRSLRARIE